MTNRTRCGTSPAAADPRPFSPPVGSQQPLGQFVRRRPGREVCCHPARRLCRPADGRGSTQRLLEHSSPQLTNDVYTNIDPVLRQAMDQLPVADWL